LKSHFSRAIAAAIAAASEAAGRRKGDSGIWRRRYGEHAIRDAGDLERRLNDIHGNPVKQGLVTAPTIGRIRRGVGGSGRMQRRFRQCRTIGARQASGRRWAP
jgi:hypothetical protein